MKLILDRGKCTGCKICELVCSAAHRGVFNPAKSHIKIKRTDTKSPDEEFIRTCTLCLSCVENCPPEAIVFNGNWLTVDGETCSGCGQCVDACPQGIIYLDDDGKAAVPDFCKGAPSCIAWCPHDALGKEDGEHDL